MLLSPVEVIDKFNNIKDKYRNLYFDIYIVLIMCDWKPLDDYIGGENFDFLVTSDLYDKYITEEDYSYAEVVDLDNIESFEVQIYNCKNIILSINYLCTIKDFSNIVIKDLLEDYKIEASNYKLELDTIFNDNNWIELSIKDVHGEGCNEDIFELEIYVSPFMQSISEYIHINKDNIHCLLNDYPNLIVDSNLWWGFEK